MAGVLRQYQGDSLYLAAFAVCLVLLYWKEKKQGGDYQLRQHKESS